MSEVLKKARKALLISVHTCIQPYNHTNNFIQPTASTQSFRRDSVDGDKTPTPLQKPGGSSGPARGGASPAWSAFPSSSMALTLRCVRKWVQTSFPGHHPTLFGAFFPFQKVLYNLVFKRNWGLPGPLPPPPPGYPRTLVTVCPPTPPGHFCTAAFSFSNVFIAVFCLIFCGVGIESWDP